MTTRSHVLDREVFPQQPQCILQRAKILNLKYNDCRLMVVNRFRKSTESQDNEENEAGGISMTLINGQIKHCNVD